MRCALAAAGRLYGRSAATNSQLMRDGKYILKAQRAGAPSDYIFENMTVHRFNRCAGVRSCCRKCIFENMTVHFFNGKGYISRRVLFL
eukprot:1159405-Pelagomonas_calceolata.AAC.3